MPYTTKSRRRIPDGCGRQRSAIPATIFKTESCSGSVTQALESIVEIDSSTVQISSIEFRGLSRLRPVESPCAIEQSGRWESNTSELTNQCVTTHLSVPVESKSTFSNRRYADSTVRISLHKSASPGNQARGQSRNKKQWLAARLADERAFSFLRMNGFYDAYGVSTPGGALVRPAMRRLIPMESGDGAAGVLIRICSSVISKGREIRIRPGINAHGSNGLRLLCALHRGPERNDGTSSNKQRKGT